jgi:hypothetical protein
MKSYSEFKYVVRWRYLDSLDSIRYSKYDLKIRKSVKEELVSQAKMEIAVSILMGNGIIFPSNQLIDSFGFLYIVSKMIQAFKYYSSKNYDLFFPMRFGFYDYRNDTGGQSIIKDPFALAAHLFKKDGIAGRQYYELSAWPNLIDNRADWAKELANKCISIPEKYIGNDDDEPLLAQALIQVLWFFNDRPKLIKPIESTAVNRMTMFKYVSTLTPKIIENDKFLLRILKPSESVVFDDRKNKLDSIVDIFRKLRPITIIVNGEEKSIIDNRSEIRKELWKNENLYFQGTVDSVDEQRSGVLSIIDSIYNFSSFLGVHARQDCHTDSMNEKPGWGYDELAFALGQWIRGKYTQNIVGKTNDITTTMDSYISPTPGDFGWEIDRFPEFWKNFFDFQRSEDWQGSLKTYTEQLWIFESEKNKYVNSPVEDRTGIWKKRLLNIAKEYEGRRYDHIGVINKFLDKSDFVINIDETKNTTELIHQNADKKILGRIQLENFGENPLLTKQEKNALHAEISASQEITEKGEVAEFGQEGSWII